MSKRLLLADGDPKGLKVLDVSLRGAGFEVEATATGTEAWALVQVDPPDLIIAAAGLPEIDGFELCTRVRGLPHGVSIPFILLAADHSVQGKMRGLEVGADDYLIQPAYVQEILARTRALLQRQDRSRMATDGNEGWSGNLAEIGVVDLIELIDGNGRSAIVHLRAAQGSVATLYFRQGRVVDAEVGRLSGLDALGRLFSWTEGIFEIAWKSVRRADVIGRPSAELIIEGMRRLDGWNRLSQQLPEMTTTVFEVDYRILSERLAEMPDEVNGILRLCDGVRSLSQVIEDCALPDLDALTIVGRLRDEGIIYEVSRNKPTREAADGIGEPSAPRGAPLHQETERLGSSSGAVVQSFAERLLTETGRPDLAGAAARGVPARAAASRSDAITGAVPADSADPLHRRTVPGFGRVVSDLMAAELSSADGGPNPLEAVPAQRSDQDSVIRLPTDVPSPADPLAATAPLGAATPGQEVTKSARAEQTPSPFALPESAAPVAPIASSETQRGVGPFPRASDREDDGVVQIEVADRTSRRNSGLSPQLTPSEGTPLAAAAAEISRPAAIPVKSPAAAEETLRVHFRDEDMSRDEALEELGLSGRGRGVRVLIAALVIGVVAAFAAQRLRSRNVTKNLATGTAPAKNPSAETVAAKSPGTTSPPAARPSTSAPPAVPPATRPALAAASGTAPTVETTPTAPLHGAPPVVGAAPPVAVGVAPAVPGEKGSALAQATPPPRAEALARQQASAVPSGPLAQTTKPADLVLPPSQPPKMPTTASPPPRATPERPATESPSASGAAPAGAKSPVRPQQAAVVASSPVAPPDRARARGSAPVPVAGSATAPAEARALDLPRQLAECRGFVTRSRFREAAGACAAAAQANPGSAEALTLLAHVELNRGRMSRASALAQKAVAIDPNLADAYVIIGGVDQDSGRNHEAKAAYTHYLQLAPQGRYAGELRSILGSL